MGKKEQVECKHIKKVLRWGVNNSDGKADFYVAFWGCTKCDWTEENIIN